MFDYFEGKIVELGPMSVVLEVGGIGYQLTISLESSEVLRNVKQTRLFTHLHVRDTEHRLFGFASREERALFQLLLTVSGVGPSLAIKILSGCPHRDLRHVIQQEDLDRLKSVRGVGAKTAQRIIVDLKDTIRTLGDAPVDTAHRTRPSADAKAWEDALLALIALGYSRSAAEKGMSRAIQSAGGNVSVQDLVRDSLRFL